LGEAVATLWSNRKASSHLVDCFAMELRLSHGRGAAAGRSMSRGRGLHGCGNRSQNRFFGLQTREPPLPDRSALKRGVMPSPVCPPAAAPERRAW
jgi:hypothetical protein